MQCIISIYKHIARHDKQETSRTGSFRRLVAVRSVPCSGIHFYFKDLNVGSRIFYFEVCHVVVFSLIFIDLNVGFGIFYFEVCYVVVFNCRAGTKSTLLFTTGIKLLPGLIEFQVYKISICFPLQELTGALIYSYSVLSPLAKESCHLWKPSSSSIVIICPTSPLVNI